MSEIIWSALRVRAQSILAFGVIACSQHENRTDASASSASHSAKRDTVALRSESTNAGSDPRDLFGDWVVVGHGFAAVSALGETEATQRHGMQATFSRDLVRFGSDTCTAPSFSEQVVNAEEYFSYQFRTTPQEASIQPDSAGRLRITEIRCRGEEWFGTPSTVYWTGTRIALNDYGAFLILQRRPAIVRR